MGHVRGSFPNTSPGESSVLWAQARAPRSSGSGSEFRQSREQLLAVALQLRRADPRHRRQLCKRARRPGHELRKRPVVEDDVSGDLLGARPREAPLLQRLDGWGLLERRAVPLRESGRSRAHAELVEEPARLALPRHEQMPLRPRRPDVEQAPLLGDLAAAHRELALLDTRQEDGLPLEPFRPMQRQQVYAAAGALPEALVEQVDEAVDLAGELLG